MKKIFISWSMSIKKLPPKIEKTLDLLIEKKYKILVWDAIWIDELIQDFFCKKNYFYVFIYSISDPRVYKTEKFKNIKVKINENIKDLRERQSQKDIFMTDQSDVSLVIWDWKSKWSYNNIIRLIEKNKEIQIFYNDNFINKENLNINYINKIYDENHKYSLSEYIKEEKSKIKNVKEMKEILINNLIISKDEVINEKYQKDVDFKMNRWKKIFVYSKKLLDKLFYTNNVKNNYIHNESNLTLF